MTNKSKKEKKKAYRQAQAEKKPLMSARQKKVFLIILLVLIFAVPVVDNLRCKAACMKRVKTPYPQIACRYECPWPWQKSE